MSYIRETRVPVRTWEHFYTIITVFLMPVTWSDLGWEGVSCGDTDSKKFKEFAYLKKIIKREGKIWHLWILSCVKISTLSQAMNNPKCIFQLWSNIWLDLSHSHQMTSRCDRATFKLHSASLILHSSSCVEIDCCNHSATAFSYKCKFLRYSGLFSTQSSEKSEFLEVWSAATGFSPGPMNFLSFNIKVLRTSMTEGSSHKSICTTNWTWLLYWCNYGVNYREMLVAVQEDGSDPVTEVITTRSVASNEIFILFRDQLKHCRLYRCPWLQLCFSGALLIQIHWNKIITAFDEVKCF